MLAKFKSFRGTLGATAILLAMAICSPAQTFTTLTTLTTTVGINPLSPLVQGFDGNFYGTSFEGGVNGWGSFFQITPAGAATLLYSFCPNYNDNNGCPLGAYPQGSVALGTDGYFYGITQGGALAEAGQGTIYKISSAGSMTVLHQFCQTTCNDGAFPTLGLTMSSSEEFYGFSNPGEKNTEAFYGQAFKIAANGQFHNVLTVCPNTICPTDPGPIGSLLLSGGGALIGPGPGPGGPPDPTALYKMTTAGVPSVLYSFCADSTCHDGSGYIHTPLVQSATGQIIGTFVQGGSGAYCLQTGGCGTAFRVTTTGSGSLAKLHDFCSVASCLDGWNVNALILASDGNYYGTTAQGGSHGYGTLFRITSTGHFSIVHTFTVADGYSPTAIPLLQGTDGNLYGATSSTIYRVTLGLPAFVKPVLNNGTVGNPLTILGNGLTGTTSVTFNGVAATFTVVSDTEITTNIPTGATTGTITLVTPTTTLHSILPFQVLP
jgi:uncharacterized repeat protein (TIGR03803 family)